MSTSTYGQQPAAATIAINVRRVMARLGLTYGDVVDATGLDERTIRGLVRGASKPHSRTLYKFSQGLDVSIDELFQPAPTSRQDFDRATNPIVECVVQEFPLSFAAWSDADFDELYSRVGVGGPLNESGVLAAAEAINTKRSILQQVCVILESGESELLADFVRLLYRRIALTDDSAEQEER